MADSDSDSDDSDIYITNSTSKLEDELVTYLEKKREDRKVSRIHLNSIK
jgi:hypothetical protein